MKGDWNCLLEIEAFDWVGLPMLARTHATRVRQRGIMKMLHVQEMHPIPYSL